MSPRSSREKTSLWGTAGKQARFLNRLRRLLGKIEEPDRKLLLYMAQKLASR